jgi:predicted phage terminase large subunit-like protein
MQRIHEQDATARLVEQGYELLCLPAEFEPKRRCRTSIGWEDPRQHEGELLFPQLYNQDVLARVKARGEAIYSALYQQRPTSADGDEIKRIWWQYWHPRGQKLPPVPVRTASGHQSVDSVELPAGFEYVAQSWDMSFKGDETSSFVVGQVWGKSQARFFLLDQVRARLSFTETIAAIERMCRKWPNTRAKLIEDAANGPAIIDTLRRKIPGLIPIRAKDSKVGRARSVGPLIEAGNVFLPHPHIAPRITPGFIDEWAGIPEPAYWDQIDAASQFLNRAFVPQSPWLTVGRH